MPRRRKAKTLLASAFALPSLLITVFAPAMAHASPSASGPLALITGSGSSWAANAVNQWIANVRSSGVQVVFTPDGSAAGRQEYALHTTDFGVSDIGYQGFDPVTGSNDVSHRPYAYLPVTAGGTSFPYNLVVGGKRVINLRLSGLTIAKIFTNQITNWDSSAIEHDNNRTTPFPSLPITVVVPSEGSGTTAMFTRYLNFEFPTMWKAFNNGVAGMTEYWPRQGPNQIAQNGSSSIMNFIESPAANGSIGIDEYSYPLSAGFPVAQMENAAGYYVLPTEYNDAVALTKAQINMNKGSIDYLLQNLNNVYTYTDPRTYPLSSYSYTIMPTSPHDPRMAVAPGQFPSKWQTLANFLSYSICQGQTYIGPIGYSALPVNLVEAGFAQIDKIKKAAPKVDIKQLNVSNCHNPTFTFGHPNQNHLANIAPEPPLCDKQGHGPCTGTTNGNKNGGRGGNSPSPSPSGGSPSPGSSGSNPSGGTSPGGGGGSVNPITGATNPVGPSTNGGQASAVPVNLAAGQGSSLNKWLGPLAVILLLAVLVGPPLVIRWSRGGRF